VGVLPFSTFIAVLRTERPRHLALKTTFPFLSCRDIWPVLYRLAGSSTRMLQLELPEAAAGTAGASRSRLSRRQAATARYNRDRWRFAVEFTDMSDFIEVPPLLEKKRLVNYNKVVGVR
jgi:hypothetical protein